MRLYIPNMQMPKSCRKCHISQPDGCGFVCPIVTGRPIVDSLINSRHARCPLVPVPPHGRLIDADALIKSLGIGDLPIRLTYEIRNAPTVIPAEEGNDG